ncbi:Transcriptional regulatory protein OmpR [Marinomonas spartinae]|uniref:Transcriptional regulatory protein OmpR n=1 Tax=Marinomonas spartinae TaxID=1792290 RepID=A0A1A8TT86_9GAMM|nr:response regulator [Marinomonas spartinae]SBS29207.1 Transcriptional regulatory protein OmpR [Marinomonas spartinae]SBS37618.1 Transcriptional regulatory protein OmpR [Marinomonas spartinae]
MIEPNKKTLLIVDDDQDIRQLLCDVLSQKGYQVLEADSGAQMWAHLEQTQVDLILMDLYLREEDGLHLARDVRALFTMPIMMLTGKGDETDRILGLELAADDYMMKPFNLRELMARIHALLRRAIQLAPAPVLNTLEDPHDCLYFGNWVLDLTARQLLNKDGEQVVLTLGEFSLLEVLVHHPDRIFSREQLIDQSRGLEAEVFDRTVDVLILRLRRKIESNPKTPQFIKTQRGLGYFFQGPVRKN